MTRPHLFVDISAHGLGHLAQAAPILNELTCQLPDLRLTLRSGIPSDKLRSRLHANFTHVQECSDFGFVMHDAMHINYAASAALYRSRHEYWSQLVANEAEFLRNLQPDLVLTDVAYLPLAGAQFAGIPSLSMCSLNWADLFAHVFGAAAWAKQIHGEMLAAYRSSECFLRLTPAMPMNDLPRQLAIAPVAALGQDCRAELCAQIGCASHERLVLIAFGGLDKQLPVENWPYIDGVRWLVPQSWEIKRGNMLAVETLGRPFVDLLSSVDAVLTKPGYGTFTEAACNGTAVLYLKRDNWPEQDCLIEWLKGNARCREIGETELLSGQLQTALEDLWQQEKPQIPLSCGAQQAAALIKARLQGAVEPSIYQASEECSA